MAKVEDHLCHAGFIIMDWEKQRMLTPAEVELTVEEVHYLMNTSRYGVKWLRG